MNRRSLGRGLSALLGAQEDDEAMAVPSSDICSGTSENGGPAFEIDVVQIDPNPFQPRREFDPAELDGLAESIRVHGVLQPIVVRKIDDRFQLIAGERRLRAAQHLGNARILARVVEFDDQQTCEIALVENLQRQDLNAIEKAHAFEKYIEQFQATHESLAARLGIDRSTVTNLLRLLELPDAVQEMVVRGKISNGHARAILSLDDPIAQLTTAQEVADQSLSVRQTEALVRQRRESPTSGETPSDIMQSSESPRADKTHHVQSLENELSQRFGTKVSIESKKDRGRIVLTFASNDEFERLLAQLRQS